MGRSLTKNQKQLIDNFLNKINQEQKYLYKATFRDGVRNQHFGKPKVEWKDLPTDTRNAIVKIHNFETIHVEAQCYIDERQSVDFIEIDHGGLTDV